MLRLIYELGTGEAQVFELQPGVNYVGRREDNHVSLPCASVSGRHCCITVEEGRVVLTDLNSTNGSFVGNQQVTTVNLQLGQRFRLGDVELHLEEAAGSTAAPAVKPPGVRLRVTATPAPSAPVAPPPPTATALAIATPPAAPTPAPAVAADQPAMCRYHPKSMARWHCGKCGKSYCDMCVSTRATPHGTVHVCRTCGVDCSPLTPHVAPAKRRSFFAVLPGAFIYPFKQGILALVVGSLIYAVLRIGAHYVAGIWGIFVIIFFYGYFFSYMQNVIHTTAMGESDAEWPMPSEPFSEIVVPFFQLLVCVLFSFGPAIGLLVWGAIGGNVAIIIGAIAAFIYGCLYFPMAFLSVAMFDSVAGINPVVVIPSIAKVFLQYILACIVLAIVFGVNKGMQVGLAILMPIPFIPDAITSLFTLYFLLVEARMLGLLYWTTKHKLGWFAR